MDRERITISIKKNVLEKIDHTIDGTSVRNRSHAIETLALKSLGGATSNQAVIILGGDDAIKAIPAAKAYLPKLKEAGFDSVVIAVGFLADKVKEKIGFGVEYDLTIKYSDKGEGSGGALNILKKELQSTFIVINTAKEYEIDLKNLLEYHRNHKSKFTIATDDIKSMLGIYVIEPEILSIIPKGFSMLDDDVIPKLVNDKEIIIYPINNN
jgi:NDP-sugar pyrophosphorylase family protein